MLRGVFDTVVSVRSLISRHSYSGQLVFADADQYQRVLSEPLVAEILAVLQRPELTRKFVTLQRLDVREILSPVEQAELVDVGEMKAVSRDPKDDHVLATAKSGMQRTL